MGNATRTLHDPTFHVGSRSAWVRVTQGDGGTDELKYRRIYFILWLGGPYETLWWSKDIV